MTRSDRRSVQNPRTLAGIYPPLVRHAIEHFKSPDVMRFLGGKVHGNFTGEIITSFKNRPEGVRVKHRVRGNSIKMYDKAGSVLRVETTIARTKDFKVLRPPHDKPKGKLDRANGAPLAETNVRLDLVALGGVPLGVEGRCALSQTQRTDAAGTAEYRLHAGAPATAEIRLQPRR